MHQGEVHSSSNPARVFLPKIGVIDWGCNGTLDEFDRESFGSLPITHRISKKRCRYDCDTTICPRGFSCASIIGSKQRFVKFFNMPEKEFKGIFPEAQLHFYPIGCCGTCNPSSDHLLMDVVLKALDRAISDKVKVVLPCMNLLPLNRVYNYKNIEDDKVGMKFLDVYKNGALPCVPSGDEGPARGSTQYGGPWCMIVGACTDKKILQTDIEIATTDEHEKFMPIERLEGVSLNVITTGFLPLRVDNKNDPTEGILVANMQSNECLLIPADPNYKSTVVGPYATRIPCASITKGQVDQLLKLHAQHGGRLFLRISESKYHKDERCDLVTNFSSRGPSELYPDNLIPDVVAPGYAVLMPHQTNIPLNNDKNWICQDSTISSGTSYACAQVAAYALKVFSHHPDWDPTAVKSALITTASSFAARCNIPRNQFTPGNEFAFGAGLIDIKKAVNPGLVYEESWYNFDKYVKQDLKIYDLNLPTFAASFCYSHVQCERIFKRELKNVGERDVTYKCSVVIFDKSLDPNVSIIAKPDELSFGPGEKHKFDLHVNILPRGLGAQVSGMVKWEPLSPECHQSVCSPIYLYHESLYDNFSWYE